MKTKLALASLAMLAAVLAGCNKPETDSVIGVTNSVPKEAPAMTNTISTNSMTTNSMGNMNQPPPAAEPAK